MLVYVLNGGYIHHVNNYHKVKAVEVTVGPEMNWSGPRYELAQHKLTASSAD